MLKKTLTPFILLVFFALMTSVVCAEETLEEKVSELKAKWESADFGPPEIHMIDDHWTAWYPPVEVPENAYIIKTGDTLWDLSLEFFGENYLWPQLWEYNMYIEDAHWIYPGDPLNVEKPVKVDDSPPVFEPDPAEEEEKTAVITPVEVEAPGTIAIYGDLYCSMYIAENIDSENQVVIMGAEETKKGSLSERDLVYINAGSAEGVGSDGVFGIFRVSQKLNHPVTGKFFGTVIEKIGKLEVVHLRDHTATAEIVNVCDEVRVGDFLLPWKAVGNPEEGDSKYKAIGYELTGKTGGYIVFAKNNQHSLGVGNIVTIDVGSSQGIKPGDYFIIYADSAVGSGYDVRVLGELAVLFCEQNSSTCKILISRVDVPVGSKVELE